MFITPDDCHILFKSALKNVFRIIVAVNLF